MPEESNPYAAVIADLKQRRDKLDQMIADLEAMAHGQPLSARTAPELPETAKEGDATRPHDDRDNPYLGMSIVDATKALLGKRRKLMSAAEIVAELEAGGLLLSGANKANTVGSVLNRRQKQVGDIVSPKRGKWALKEWVPGRTFGKNGQKTEESEREAPETEGEAADSSEPDLTSEEMAQTTGEDVSDPSEPEQPSEPASIFPLRSNG